MIKKTYKEIVVGVVIGVIVAGVLLLINEAYNFFTLKLLIDIWKYSATFEFRLVYFVGVIGLSYFLYSIVFKLIKRNKKPVIDEMIERRKEFCEANTKSEDSGNKLLCRFTTNIDLFTNRPYINDIKVYCTKHKPPLEVYINGCTVAGCKNGKKILNLDAIERTINSTLVYRWEELNDR
jgi:hypothetical protein